MASYLDKPAEKSKQIIQILQQNPQALASLIEVSHPEKIIQALQYHHRNFDTTFKKTDKEIVLQALTLSAAQIFKEHNQKEPSSVFTNQDLIENSWNIYYVIDKIELTDFLNFQKSALKNLQIFSSFINTVARQHKVKNSLRTLFACWVKFASKCPETQKSQFFQEAKEFFKILKSNSFLNKNGFLPTPEFFLEKIHLVFPLHLHLTDNKNECVEKALTFVDFYLQNSYFKNQKSKREKAQRQDYDARAAQVLTWLEKECTHLSLQAHQDLLAIFSRIFSYPLESANQKIKNALLSSAQSYLVYQKNKNARAQLNLYSQQDLNKWGHEVFRALYLFQFNDKEIFSSFSSQQIQELRTYLRQNDYLIQQASQYSYGKVLPLSYFIKTLYLDREEIMGHYGKKYKNMVAQLKLNLHKFEDFKTFILLCAGKDILEKSNLFVRQKFLTMLDAQKILAEKKAFQRQDSIKNSCVPMKQKFKL